MIIETRVLVFRIMQKNKQEQQEQRINKQETKQTVQGSRIVNSALKNRVHSC